MSSSLVELIVLNVGLSAGILNARVFSMFVFMAIILTLAVSLSWDGSRSARWEMLTCSADTILQTTPLTLLCYPARVRETIASTRAARKSVGVVPSPTASTFSTGVRILTIKALVVLNRMENVPAALTIIQLLQPKQKISESTSPTITEKEEEVMEVDALRLIELTGRMTAVMKSADADDILRRDTVTQVFRTVSPLASLPR